MFGCDQFVLSSSSESVNSITSYAYLPKQMRQQLLSEDAVCSTLVFILQLLPVFVMSKIHRLFPIYVVCTENLIFGYHSFS